MSSKIAHLSELESVLCNNEKTDKGVLHFFTTFKIARLLKAFCAAKVYTGCKTLIRILSKRLMTTPFTG